MASITTADFRNGMGLKLSLIHIFVAGPNVEGVKLTVPEGKTVVQTASIVEEVYGLSLIHI